ncbi:MAG: imidazole glycerol phosphate synthase subunit HisF [Magnetovibrio sp.]|nr:imidazole glycerol phosphate synthase subunit HisF [Magnetovibrio sp.]
MLRKRLITVLTFNDGVLFRTKLFEPDYRYTLSFVDAWSVDEVVILDVTRPGQGDRQNFYKVVEHFARKCFVPLAVGGGIRDVDEVRRLLGYGADKVVLNTGALEQPRLITETAKLYGAQCVVLSIDAKKIDENRYEVYSTFGSQPTGKSPTEWAAQGEALGAGEVLITAIERDGWLQGYDLDLCREVSEAVNVPVLALGGAGSWKHFAEAFKQCGVSGVCTQNIYHFTEQSIHSAKAFLAKNGVDVRL